MFQELLDKITASTTKQIAPLVNSVSQLGSQSLQGAAKVASSLDSLPTALSPIPTVASIITKFQQLVLGQQKQVPTGTLPPTPPIREVKEMKAVTGHALYFHIFKSVALILLATGLILLFVPALLNKRPQYYY